MVLVRRVNLVGDFAEERVEIGSTGIALLRVWKVLDLVRLPVEAVVVLVSEKPHEEPRSVLVLLDERCDLFFHEGAKALLRVIDRANPDAVDRHAVAPHAMVQDRVNSVLLVDVLDPSGRDADVLANDVDPHLLQEAHFIIERFDDDLVRLAPEVIGVVFADGHVAPVHAEHHRGLAVDEKKRAGFIFVNTHDVGTVLRHRRACGPGLRRGRSCGGRRRRRVLGQHRDAWPRRLVGQWRLAPRRHRRARRSRNTVFLSELLCGREGRPREEQQRRDPEPHAARPSPRRLLLTMRLYM